MKEKTGEDEDLQRKTPEHTDTDTDGGGSEQEATNMYKQAICNYIV